MVDNKNFDPAREWRSLIPLPVFEEEPECKELKEPVVLWHQSRAYRDYSDGLRCMFFRIFRAEYYPYRIFRLPSNILPDVFSRKSVHEQTPDAAVRKAIPNNKNVFAKTDLLLYFTAGFSFINTRNKGRQALKKRL